MLIPNEKEYYYDHVNQCIRRKNTKFHVSKEDRLWFRYKLKQSILETINAEKQKSSPVAVATTPPEDSPVVPTNGGSLAPLGSQTL